MKKQKISPLFLTVPITRVDEETREVEGYAFVNEVVPGEGGIRLKRTAMEAATEDYMKWAAVREMHQPSAVGTALEARWDEKGLVIRSKIVDDAAWEKVKEGVYKAYSVGVQPRVMRGKDVEACTHIETSLVDRPKDEDAVLFRVDGIEDGDCDMHEEGAPSADSVARGMFSDQWDRRERNALYYAAFETLSSVLYEIQSSREDGREAMARQAILEFADVVAPLCERSEIPQVTRAEILARTQEPGQAGYQAVSQVTREDLERIEATISAKDAELATVRADLAASVERVKALEQQPGPMKAVRFPSVPLERTFAANEAVGDSATDQESEVQRLCAEASNPETSDMRRQEIAARLIVIGSAH